MQTQVTGETLALCSSQSRSALGTNTRLTHPYTIPNYQTVDGCERGRVHANDTTQDELSFHWLNVQKWEFCKTTSEQLQ